MSKCCRFIYVASLTFIVFLTASAARAAESSLSDAVARARQCGVLSETIDAVGARVEDGTVSKSDGAKLLAPLLTACEKQLPLAPLADKLSEGLAKHVAPPLVVRVLKRKLEAYVFARSLLNGHYESQEPQLLVVVGEGVFEGVNRADFETFFSVFSSEAAEPFLVGAHMTSLLGQIGFDFGLTRSMLEAAFDVGGPSQDWRYFVRLVLVARKRGVTDQAIADAARDALSQNGSPDDVSARLGFTGRNMTGQRYSN